MSESVYEGCNVLLLGMSFAAGYSKIEEVIKDVSIGRLSEIDGRDSARCLMLEGLFGVSVYTVSLETAATYREDRHFHGNFNHRNFVRDFKEALGQRQFKQIILDYYWMPSGSWEQHHWKRDFFRRTLISFAESGLLKDVAGNDVESGVVLLPFSFYCHKEVVLAASLLSRWYSITYIRKGELHNNLLWFATQYIDEDDMIKVFGKLRNQEDMYCTFDPNRMQQMLNSDEPIGIRELREATLSLKRLKDIRFIALRRV